MEYKIDYKVNLPGYEDCVIKVTSYRDEIEFRAYLGDSHESFKKASTLDKLIDALTALSKKKIMAVPVIKAGDWRYNGTEILYGRISSNPDPDTIWVVWQKEETLRGGKKKVVSSKEKFSLKDSYRNADSLIIDTPENRKLVEEYSATMKRLDDESKECEKKFQASVTRFDKSMIREVET